MFDNPIINELYNKYRENKLAHAYLIETNNIEKATEEIKTLIKMINCPEKYTKECFKCNLCNLINKNSIPSLKIIEPEGTSIKKNQIEELKEMFASIPIYTKYNVYIIKNAEKLNNSSANSMLKFVEEPTSGILGFFITNNKDIMIETIKSRCQSLLLNYELKSIIENLSITQQEYDNYLEIIKKYLNKINQNELINNKKEILNIYPERKDIENILKIILNIYYQNFLKNINANYDQTIIDIYELKEDTKIISTKLNIITKILQEMSYNVSMELILDKFIIEMRGNNG